MLTPSRVPQRSSSVNASTPSLPVTDAPAPFDRSPINKPLPRLPPHDGRSQSTAALVAPRAVSLPVTPPPPTDIVVTPSSPLEKDPFEGLFGLGASPPNFASALGTHTTAGSVERRPISAPVSRSSSVRTPRAAAGPSRARPESPTPMRADSLGLGLPEAVAAKRASTSAGHRDPQRPQAVSSPLPQRSTSPAVKVTFSAAEMAKSQERKPVKNRPRSLSAMFSRSPVVDTAPTTDDEEPSSSKIGSWLGVGRVKTIKRRRSESKLRKRRSGFFSENEAAPSGSSTDDQSVNQASLRPLANASTPVLINRSTAEVTRQPHSAGSSLSSLPTIDQQEFWPAREWNPQAATPEVETMFSETAPTPQSAPTSQSDSKRASAPVHSNNSRENVARRLLDPPISQRSSMGSNSPLSSLPELGPPPTIAEHAGEATTPPPPVTPQPRRGRSISDATRRLQSEEGSLPSSPRSLRSPSDLDLPRSPRPPMSSRSHSGSSSVLGMVRSVFSKNRPRSNSALRYAASADERDVSAAGEFGGRGDLAPPRPASSASTSSVGGPSPALPPVRIRPEDVPQISTLALQNGEDDRRVVLSETPERSPRSSYAASQSSRTTLSTRRSATADPHANLAVHSGARTGRARAQTISSGTVSWHGALGGSSTPTANGGRGPTHRSSHDNGLAPPSAFGSSTYLPAPSTPTFPTAATPPRQRPGSIRRLSTGLFRSNPSSPKPPPGQLFPLPPRGPTGGSSGGPSPVNDEHPSRVSSPLPLSRSATPVQHVSADDIDTSVREDDTPESWLERLVNIDRRELAGVLAAR